MIPIVTPAEMNAIDRAAPEPVETLIARAGAATARAALSMLGGGYGRRVVVLVGPGNNGNDGRDAARRLARRGVRVELHELGALPARVERADLVVDAVLGTGARPGFRGPEIADGVPVLAVDLPSGLDGTTGQGDQGVIEALHTVTFAALKPGLVLEPGHSLAGRVEVADIGLDTDTARSWLLTDDDVATALPARPATAHKWQSAVRVVAGSPGMTGAAHLAARGAMRSGAGYVRLSSPGIADDPARPPEVVGAELPATDWAGAVLGDLDRFGSLLVGPGLGRAPDTATAIRQVVEHASVPTVVDGDGLTALGRDAATVLRRRTVAAVLTPHDGEFELLTGRRPGPDRFAEVRELAAATGSIVLLKGATTLVAGPHGAVLVTTRGDSRLASAGTGDVLAGMIAALVAAGAEPFTAAALGAHLHGWAGTVGSWRGVVAGDVADHLPFVFDQLAVETTDAP